MKHEVSRRAFLERLGTGALGAAAVSQLAGRPVRAQSGRSHAGMGPLPASSRAWTVPPVLNNPNILVVMVDQMRWPVWMNAAQTAVFEQQLMPNLMGMVRDNAYVFQQFHTAATICTAARGALLTGLYAPQTACYTNALGAGGIHALVPQFPTWATAVQALNPAYKDNVWWFGKWHVSPCQGNAPLKPYGFQTRTYPGMGNPSPNGQPNEGTHGGKFGKEVWASDAEIANDFIGWLQGQAPTTAPASPWCAMVSLVNPHDIAEGPAWLESSPFPPTQVPPKPIYFPPPALPPAGGIPAVYTGRPSPWNNEDLKKVLNKPALQYAFQKASNASHGLVAEWYIFLNWYYWLHYYVDLQIGAVLNALNNSAYASNTVVVFLADHGESGGSHGLHDKGGCAYDEILHVPLYVHFPGQAGSIPMEQMCCSVDFFGLIADLATSGGGAWQQTYPDLANRQSLWNFLYSNAAETRVAPTLGVPYILHTADDSEADGGLAEHHIVCFRTKADASNLIQPGGKLNIYSAWNKCHTTPNGKLVDYEFYDYNPATSNNLAELGNDYGSSNPVTQATIGQYFSELGSWGPPGTGLIGNELNRPLVGTGTDGNPLTQAQIKAQQNYFDFTYGKGKCVA